MDRIDLVISGNRIKTVQRPSYITSGTVGLPVEFAFDSLWDDLTKMAVFSAGLVSRTVSLSQNDTVVPWEVLKEPNTWLRVGVYGVNAGGTVATPTLYADVCVILPGADPDADPAMEPTHPVWKELMDRVEELEENGSGVAGVGIASVEQTTTSTEDGGTNVITITLSDGTAETFAVKNGSKGSPGTTGETGADGYTPVKGVDYFTEADKAEIIAAVMEGIGCPVFGVVDENNNIVLTGTLRDGSYSVKYEMKDGSTVDIGALVVNDPEPDEPAYTNFADPTSSDWVEPGRISNTGINGVTSSSAEGLVVTNYIPVEYGDVLEVGGSKFNKGSTYYRFAVYSGTTHSTRIFNEAYNVENAYVDTVSENQLEIVNDAVKYIRLTLVPGADSSAIAIHIKRNGEWL